jgi:DNA-directed RNA polymerase specialized sigma24 family protein
VTALYERHAVSMIRIALIMLGDRAAAEDVVQDAFFGLYRRWRRAWVQPGPAAASGGAWPPG